MAAIYKTGCIGFEQLTSLSVAAGLTAASYKDATIALIECDHTANKYVRFRSDGADPTATVGISLAPGEKVAYEGNLSQIKIIEEVAGAKVNIEYYR